MDHIAAAASPTLVLLVVFMLAGKATAKLCAGGPKWAVLALACSCLAAGCLWRRRRRRRSWCFCCCFLGTGSGTTGDASSDASSLGGRLAGLAGAHGHGGSSSSSLTGGGPGGPGGVYTPPHQLQRHRRLARYARCAAHPPPPPYTEVASKPDLYPLVISYDEQGAKAGAIPPGANYLMVQYFRNCLVRGAVGSLSATSTLDSLSSSFLCNAANEANTMVPPTYSCAASLDEFRVGTPASIATAATGPGVITAGLGGGGTGGPISVTRSISSIGSFDPSSIAAPPVPLTPVSTSSTPARPTITTTPTGPTGTTPPAGTTTGPRNAAVSSSATGSEVSSLAGLGTPGSPPRATSPTLELRELLDKIQLLPHREEPRHPPLPMRRSNQSSTRPPPPPRRKPSLYMPLDGATPSSTRSKFSGRYYGWPSALSKSAPATPSSPLPPPPAPTPSANNRRPSDSAVIDDGSPLLNPDAASSEEEEEEENNDVIEQLEDEDL